MNRQEHKHALEMLEQGYSYQAIAKELGPGVVWKEVRDCAIRKRKPSWEAAKRMISGRLRKLGRLAAARDDVRDISHLVDWLYECARKMQVAAYPQRTTVHSSRRRQHP